MVIFDPEHLLAALQWETRDRLEELGKKFTRATGLVLKMRSGLRSCGEQDALYAQGRSTGGNIVTYAPGCVSWHVHGRAADMDPVDPQTGAIVAREADYQAAGLIWERLGGVWGGRFEGFGGGDIGHFEWHPGLTLNDVCPNPAHCTEVKIDTTAPVLPWMVAGGAVLGLGAWLFWDDARALFGRARSWT